jgi:hypothetical protein
MYQSRKLSSVDKNIVFYMQGPMFEHQILHLSTLKVEFLVTWLLD